MTHPEHAPIQIGTEYIGPGCWRAVVRSQDGKVLEALGLAKSAAGVAGYSLQYIVQKDLQGWRAVFD